MNFTWISKIEYWKGKLLIHQHKTNRVTTASYLLTLISHLSQNNKTQGILVHMLCYLTSLLSPALCFDWTIHIEWILIEHIQQYTIQVWTQAFFLIFGRFSSIKILAYNTQGRLVHFQKCYSNCTITSSMLDKIRQK